MTPRKPRDTHVYRDLSDALRRKARHHGWPCHICGRPIAWDADWRDGQSYTYDHDVPVALGGDPRGPGKPAHRSCNTRRGIRVDWRPAERPVTSTDW